MLIGLKIWGYHIPSTNRDGYHIPSANKDGYHIPSTNEDGYHIPSTYEDIKKDLTFTLFTIYLGVNKCPLLLPVNFIFYL